LWGGTRAASGRRPPVLLAALLVEPRCLDAFDRGEARTEAEEWVRCLIEFER
jgi:hypothetical protein